MLLFSIWNYVMDIITEEESILFRELVNRAVMSVLDFQ